MNLSEVDFNTDKDLKYIADNGLEKYLVMVLFGNKIADSADWDKMLRKDK